MNLCCGISICHQGQTISNENGSPILYYGQLALAIIAGQSFLLIRI